MGMNASEATPRDAAAATLSHVPAEVVTRDVPTDGRLTHTDLAAEVIAAAAAAGVRIATAESLTGGLLADALVSVPGASQVFAGGIVAYHSVLKATLLAVDPDLLAERGPVDGGVAAQMAVGARAACAIPDQLTGEIGPCELGVSTTGVAGPDPDPQTGQVPGTVWIGVSVGSSAKSREFHWVGDREDIRNASVRAALDLMIEVLQAECLQGDR